MLNSIGYNKGNKKIKPFGIIDIGSNTVRLVVFEGVSRSPLIIHNEKIIAGLGRSLSASGKLDQESQEKTLNALSRYVSKCKALGAGMPKIFATAAIRDATNGQEFTEIAEKTIGGSIHVLRGREEGRYSTLGVISGFPNADGFVGDLGGGSLELVLINNGNPGDGITLPLGPLRLMGLKRSEAEDVINRFFDELDWFWDRVKGNNFYAVGGAWRSLARVDIAQKKSLEIVHSHSMDPKIVNNLTHLLSRLQGDSLKKIGGLTKRREEGLPLASLVLSRILSYSELKKVFFSGNGLREGILYDQLDSAESQLDPLIEGALRISLKSGSSSIFLEEIKEWVKPLSDESIDNRLINTACILSNIGLSVVANSPPHIIASIVLYSPLVGVTHQERAFIAQSISYRYGGRGLTLKYKHLLNENYDKYSKKLGKALRLAYQISGGGVNILPQTKLIIHKKTLSLALKNNASLLFDPTINRRLESLAKEYNYESTVTNY